jgi:hypothetical protein
MKLIIEKADINLKYKNLTLEHDQSKINYAKLEKEHAEPITKNNHNKDNAERTVNRICELIEKEQIDYTKKILLNRNFI